VKGLTMNLVPAFSWLTRLKWQRLRPAASVDFADMGTAFGLDASMDSLPAAEPAARMKRGRPIVGAPEERQSRAVRRERR
jgi:hypothetical protein